MPKGPQGQKRPADVIGCAISVAKLAVGEEEETLREKSKRTKSGQAGAKARANSLSAKKRSQIAKKAAKSRWG
jgi:hypothetical protein